MSTLNICICGEMRNVLHGYPLLSGAMVDPQFIDLNKAHFSLKKNTGSFLISLWKHVVGTH